MRVRQAAFTAAWMLVPETAMNEDDLVSRWKNNIRLTGTTSVSSGPAFLPWPLTSSSASSFNVLTTTQTTYHSVSQVVYVNLADKDLVSVGGWLFPPALSGEQPTLAAQSVVLRSTGTF